jgi:DnaJ-class molecular chaperone
MKIQCDVCNGIGIFTDENGVQKDEPCTSCCGTGYVFEEDEITK